MKKVFFKNFVIKNAYLAFDIKFDEIDDSVYFKLPESAKPKNSEIAVALASFVGQKFDEIYYELKINDLVKRKIEEWTQAKVYCEGNEEYDYFNEDNNKIIINFSGGLDSLAVKSLLPNDSILLSTYYLGNYKREYDFFVRFKPELVETNFRSLGYNLNSDAFMGASAILLKSYFGAKYSIFGDVFEAFYNIVPGINTTNLNDAIGYVVPNYILGLTEIATSMISLYYVPELIKESLSSLSSPGMEKYNRKSNILNILIDRYNISMQHFEIVEVNKPLEFGDSISVDFIALYEIKHSGIEFVSKKLKNIPGDYINLASNLKLDFYERFNTDYMNGFRSQEEKENFLARCKEAGVLPFDENDFKELHIVLDYLLKHKDRYLNKWNAKYSDLFIRKNESKSKLPTISEEENTPYELNEVLLVYKEVNIEATDSNFKYCVLLKDMEQGIYRIRYDLVDINNTDCFTFSLYDPINKKRLFNKTININTQNEFTFRLKRYDNLKLLIYPNIPGKTKGCSISIKIKEIGFRKM